MKRNGLTWIELLVVIVTIAILIGLLLPAIQKIREASARTQTNQHLKECTLALHRCHGVHKKFPPAAGAYGDIEGTATTPLPTLYYHLLPYLDQDNLYLNGQDSSQAYINPKNTGEPAGLADSVVKPYVTPQDPSRRDSGAGLANLAANLRVFSDNGWQTGDARKTIGRHPYPATPVPPYYPRPNQTPLFYGTATLGKSFPDGTANTLSFATAYRYCGGNAEPRYFMNPPMTQPSPFFAYYGVSKPANATSPSARLGVIFQDLPSLDQCDEDFAVQGLSGEGISVGRFDGGVFLLSTQISVNTWAALVQPNDGLPRGDFQP